MQNPPDSQMDMIRQEIARVLVPGLFSLNSNTVFSLFGILTLRSRSFAPTINDLLPDKLCKKGGVWSLPSAVMLGVQPALRHPHWRGPFLKRRCSVERWGDAAGKECWKDVVGKPQGVYIESLGYGGTLGNRKKLVNL
ncbi:hypothetical protein NPIL_598571 [Nephila pilipes]|uniref:Uncharacterized protein n=1 Tax=Nephila pilipes TaxID=299642 RepID=A0A8X6QK04_NEPPI|nr:hypothetical protein NPIL_598571 [Nephila pilipes]